ncbi:MAG: SMI1/KNR4 family protein [Phycisphaerales bacterium]|nr:SMI1/KNR4 family protein [Phycisphaerales bacterium]
MEIDAVLALLQGHAECVLRPPRGIPTITENCVLPNDLRHFYELCGGVSLFKNRDYGIDIVAPGDFVLANPVIVGESCEYDITGSWYIVARAGAQETLTIDLFPARLGRCYDSFWDCHGVRGSCPRIASSFTDLLLRLFQGGGEYWYWLQDDFPVIGDAYDDAEN